MTFFDYWRVSWRTPYTTLYIYIYRCIFQLWFCSVYILTTVSDEQMMVSVLVFSHSHSKVSMCSKETSIVVVVIINAHTTRSGYTTTLARQFSVLSIWTLLLQSFDRLPEIILPIVGTTVGCQKTITWLIHCSGLPNN